MGSTRRLPYITLSAGVTWAAVDVDAGGGGFAVLFLLGPVPSSCGYCTKLGEGGMTFARSLSTATGGPFPLSSAVGSSSGLIFIHRRPNGDEYLSGRDGFVGLLVAIITLLHLLHGRVKLLRAEVYPL